MMAAMTLYPRVPMEAREHSLMRPPGERTFLAYQQQLHLGAPLTSQLSSGPPSLGCPDPGAAVVWGGSGGSEGYSDRGDSGEAA